MPVFTLNTNLPANKIPKGFKEQAADVIATSLSKPKSYIAVQITADCNLSFGGTDEPAALCTLVSIGSLSKDLNKKHSKALMSLMKTHLGIEDSNIYITFENVSKENIGYNSTTFADLL